MSSSPPCSALSASLVKLSTLCAQAASWPRPRRASSPRLIRSSISPRISRRYHLTEQDIAWALELLTTFAQLVPVPDDEVLATGRLAQAHYLVTGDRGLLDLRAYAGMQIVTPRDFIAVLEQERGRS
jgi:hypothetical protein